MNWQSNQLGKPHKMHKICYFRATLTRQTCIDKVLNEWQRLRCYIFTYSWNLGSTSQLQDTLLYKHWFMRAVVL